MHRRRTLPKMRPLRASRWLNLRENCTLRRGDAISQLCIADKPTKNLQRHRVRHNHSMRQHVIVWDLETVPDLAGFAAANDLVGKSDAEVREAIGEKFPKHIYHSIVCIGALIAHREPDHLA